MQLWMAPPPARVHDCPPKGRWQAKQTKPEKRYHTGMHSRTRTFLCVIAASAQLLACGGLARAASVSSVLDFWQVADGNQRFTISGRVESVSYAANTLRVNAGGQTVEIFVTPTTVIEIGGESGSIGDIRKGSKVTASGVVRDGQKIALSITLR